MQNREGIPNKKLNFENPDMKDRASEILHAMLDEIYAADKAVQEATTMGHEETSVVMGERRAQEILATLGAKLVNEVTKADLRR